MQINFFDQVNDYHHFFFISEGYKSLTLFEIFKAFWD